MTVTNNGPDGATGVSVVDTLPSDVTFVSGDVDGATGQVTFDPVTGTLTANIGAMNNSDVSVVTVTVTVGANPASTLSNTATVSATPNTDSNPANNSSSISTAVNRFVDVGISKAAVGTPVSSQDITYSLTVTNSGPSDAADVIVSDTLVSDLSFVSFNPLASGATHSLAGQDLTIDVGTLAAGGSATFEFVATIAAAAVGTIANTASVTTSDSDTDLANNTVTESFVTNNQIDLILGKTVDLPTAVPGSDQLVYTFNVSHDIDSVSDANTVVVTDVIPTGLTGVVINAPTADSTDFNPTTGVITVQYNVLPNGQARTFSLTANIEEDATGTVVNNANVTSLGTDLDPANDTATASTTLTPSFDVQVAKVPDNASLIPGDTVIYTVTVTNTGPSTAPGVILTDVLPSGLTLVSATLDGQAGSESGGTITFPAVNMASGAVATGTITLTVDTLTNGLLTNTASVQDLSAAGETNIANNSDSADVTVVAEADLSVTKSVSAAASQIGGTLTYDMVVANAGPSSAANVVVSDTLPSGVTFVSGTGPAGEVLSEVGGVVTANMASLASGANGTISITVSIDPGAASSISNNVSVVSDTGDSNPANDSAVASTTVDPKTSSISGFVYIDGNNNGVKDVGELPLSGVEIRLDGTDLLGAIAPVIVLTDANGQYVFSSLAQGTYSVTETQPNIYREGLVTVGTGATANVVGSSFTDLILGENTIATDFNFGELYPLLSKRLFLSTPQLS